MEKKLNIHFFEVEEIEKKGNDTILTLDILPNRAIDCLSHYGIAKEVSALCEIPLKKTYFTPETQYAFNVGDSAMQIDIQAEGCKRYALIEIKDINLKETPDWMKERLEGIGQKSINPIVDVINYVLFDIGQPMHAFDADKVSGSFIVRDGKDGESFTSLTGDEITITEKDMVIVDGKDQKILALAGVKGGTAAMVDEHTKHIYVEVAYFNPVQVRHTQKRTGIESDAAKVFSQGYAPELIGYTAHRVAGLFEELACKNIIGSLDNTKTTLRDCTHISIDLPYIHRFLGVGDEVIAAKEVERVLSLLGFNYTKEGEKYAIDIPRERFDMQYPADVVEEIVRVLGYDRIPAKQPTREGTASIHPVTALQRYITKALTEIGLYEVITYSFREKGKVCTMHPVAVDKGCLRVALKDGLQESLKLNEHNMGLLGLQEISLFEFGSVFTPKEEYRFAVVSTAKDVVGLEKSIRDACATASFSLPEGGFKDGVWEMNMEDVGHL